MEVASRARTGSRQLGALVEIESFGQAYAASSRTFSPLAYLCAAALVIGFIAGMATGQNLPRSVGRGNAALASPTLAERVAAPSSETPSAGRVVEAVDTPFEVRLDPDAGAPRPNTPIVNAYTGFVTGSSSAP